jgi:hypothetical protein
MPKEKIVFIVEVGCAIFLLRLSAPQIFQLQVHLFKWLYVRF